MAARRRLVEGDLGGGDVAHDVFEAGAGKGGGIHSYVDDGCL